MADFIRIENLIFDYVKHEDGSAHRAIDNVSFSVEKGSFTAVIGQNGSGKSTLAKNINGLMVPTSGKIEPLRSFSTISGCCSAAALAAASFWMIAGGVPTGVSSAKSEEHS